MLKYKDTVIADAGFVINLPEREDRRNEVTQLLNELDITGWEFENGVKHDEPEWHKYGCTQTFLNIFKKAIDNNYSSIIIFEDDITLTQTITKEDIDSIFKQIKKKSRKYDFIALGTRPLWDSKIIKNSDYFGTVENCVCAHAFLYKKKFIKYIYSKLKNYKKESCPHYKVIIDEFINDCCSHKQIYKRPNKLFRAGITIPMVFTQRPSYSNNEQGFVNYQGWIEDSYWSAFTNGQNQ
jgi:hypothetical protein